MKEQALKAFLEEMGVDVIGKNGSGWIVCHCPFAPLGLHAKVVDHNPSFFAKPNAAGTSGFNCYACKTKGPVASLPAKLSALNGHNYGSLPVRMHIEESKIDFGTFGEYVEEETERPPVPVPEEAYTGIYNAAFSDSRAREYLTGRGITEQAALCADVRYDADGLRVMCPVRDEDGKLYGFTGRSVLPDDIRRNAKVKDYAGLKKQWLLLGEEHIRESDEAAASAGRQPAPLLVVEGMFAYLSMLSIRARKISNPIATMGSRLYLWQRDRIVRHRRPVYLLYDNDLAGLEGMFGPRTPEGEWKGGGAVDILSPHVPVYVCKYPEGIDDPDDFTLDHLRYAMANAEFFPPKVDIFMDKQSVFGKKTMSPKRGV